MNKAKLTASAPVLLVKDVVESAKWYVEKMGFENPEFVGEPPVFCMINRDDFQVFFSKADENKIIPNWKIVDKMWNAYFWVDDVESLYKEFIERGATIDYELHLKVYNVLEFGINDPDGYDIAFGQIMNS